MIMIKVHVIGMYHMVPCFGGRYFQDQCALCVAVQYGGESEAIQSVHTGGEIISGDERGTSRSQSEHHLPELPEF